MEKQATIPFKKIVEKTDIPENAKILRFEWDRNKEEINLIYE